MATNESHRMDDKEYTAGAISPENTLSKQITMSLTSEQYERLFFQPSAAKGDLAKRLGNPTLLGVLGFLIPFQTTMFLLLGWRGANATSQVAVSGAYYFIGGIAMAVAGICEFILGNTFPFVVFFIFGVHWMQVGYSVDPAHDLVGAYQGTGPVGSGALTKAYNSGGAFYNLTMMGVSLVFFIGSLRTNGPLALVLFCLIPLFGLLAGGQFYLGYHPDAAGLAHAGYLFEIAGGFGFVTAMAGWYLALEQCCFSTGMPWPLPTFDLASKIFNGSQTGATEHAGGNVPTSRQNRME